MPRYVALLRAINVGGHVVKMDRLRALFAEMGHTNVETFIASGNVIFDAITRKAATLERSIEQHLHAALGYEVATFVRTPDELAAIVALEPFGVSAGEETRRIYVSFLREAPSEAYVAWLMSFRSDVDDFRVFGRETYWACRVSMLDSRYGKAKGDRETPSTSRNMTTVRKLAAITS